MSIVLSKNHSIYTVVNIDKIDRQTDRHTDYRYVDRQPVYIILKLCIIIFNISL